VVWNSVGCVWYGEGVCGMVRVCVVWYSAVCVWYCIV